MNLDYPIDVVIPWVDDSDPAWRAEKQRYSPEKGPASDDGEARYRDWGTLKYVFRGIEKFMPWVNRVYFVTCGHVPEWLNLDAPKLVHVRHADYMPAEYLPTFSSHPIELNLHRIESLSEHFVYFNDDIYVTRPTDATSFFRAGRPVHPNELRPVSSASGDEVFPHIFLNNVMTINAYFDLKELIRQNPGKWFSPRTHSLKTIYKNLFFSRYHYMPGLVSGHTPVPILKSTIEKMWELEYDKLDQTSRRKFRDIRDVSQFLFRYWQISTDLFVPIKGEDVGKCFPITAKNADEICREIKKQHCHTICLNDIGQPEDPAEFEEVKNKLLEALNHILPEKSGFER